MIHFCGVQQEFASFPNGEVRLPLRGDGWDTADVWFKWEGDQSLIELGMWKAMMNRHESMYNLTFRLMIEYMPYSRMDRQTSDFFTLKYVAGLINDMNWHSVVVVEPHSDVTCALLDRSTPWYLTPEVLVQQPVFNDPDAVFDSALDYIFFPDAGAAKRYSGYFKDYNVLVGSKRRADGGTIDHYEISGLGIGNSVEGRRVIIVDDLCSYGGTFLHAANRLHGAAQIDLVVAHLERSVFSGDMYFAHTDGRPLIQNIYTTNSLSPPNRERVHIYNIRTGEWT